MGFMSRYSDGPNKGLCITHRSKQFSLFCIKSTVSFDVLLTVHLSIILVINQLNVQNFVL